MIFMLAKKGILITLAMLIIGCSTANIKDNSLPLHSITRVAVSRVLFEKPEWAASCYGITNQALESLREHKIIKVSELEKYIREQVEWDSLTIDEKILMDTLIVAVEESIEQYLKENDIGLPKDVRVQLITVLVWINETAYKHVISNYRYDTKESQYGE